MNKEQFNNETPEAQAIIVELQRLERLEKEKKMPKFFISWGFIGETVKEDGNIETQSEHYKITIEGDLAEIRTKEFVGDLISKPEVYDIHINRVD